MNPRALLALLLAVLLASLAGCGEEQAPAPLPQEQVDSWEGYGETASNGESAADRSVLEREALRLVNMGDEIFYLAKVAHNALPVAFKLVDCGDDWAVFENPDHDFPRRLEYRIAGNGMDVHVSDGLADGKGFTLRFTRR